MLRGDCSCLTSGKKPCLDDLAAILLVLRVYGEMQFMTCQRGSEEVGDDVSRQLQAPVVCLQAENPGFHSLP